MMQRVLGVLRWTKRMFVEKVWAAFWPSFEDAPVPRPRPRWILLSVTAIDAAKKERKDVTETYEELCMKGEPWWGAFFDAEKLELTYAHVSGKCFTLFLEPGRTIKFPDDLQRAYDGWTGCEKKSDLFAYVQMPDGTRSSITHAVKRFLGPLGDMHRSVASRPTVGDVLASLKLGPETLSKLVVHTVTDAMPFEFDCEKDDLASPFLASP